QPDQCWPRARGIGGQLLREPVLARGIGEHGPRGRMLLASSLLQPIERLARVRGAAAIEQQARSIELRIGNSCAGGCLIAGERAAVFTGGYPVLLEQAAEAMVCRSEIPPCRALVRRRRARKVRRRARTRFEQVRGIEVA